MPGKTMLRLVPVVVLSWTPMLPQFAQVVIQRCDVTTGWEGSAALTVDPADQKEGRGSLVTQPGTGNSTWFSKTFSQTSTGIDSTGILSLWLYVSDATKLEGGRIEISSSGGPDMKLSYWPLDNSLVVDGWNQMHLPIGEAYRTGGGASLDSVSYFRIAGELSGPVTAKIDFIRFAPSPADPAWPVLDVPRVDNSSLDGVFLQRFISAAGSIQKMNHKDTVTTHVMEGCEKYGRIFAIMYDGVANQVEEIKADWMHLVDDLGATASSRYLHHRGRPLVALWGYTVREEATVDQLVELIDWFKNHPDPKYRASLLLGVFWNWYDLDAAWMNAFRDVEVISPWFSGSTDYDRGQAWCDANNVDFLPVVHPGFSWYNLKGGPKNQHPRDGGNFFWNEVHEVVSKNAKSVYIAMFDEIDEGTALFKLAENDAMLPVEGYWLPLDEDGYTLPGDWYLRAAGLATEVVRGYRDNHAQLVPPPEGIMAIRIINEVNDNGQGGMEFVFPDFPGATTLEISMDGGATYAFSTPDDAGSFTIAGLNEGTCRVFARHSAGSPEADMGEVTIGNSVELAPTAASAPYPADRETGVRTDLTLGWKEGEYADAHSIWFGTNVPPDSIGRQAAVTFTPGALEPSATYYWRVDEVNAFGRAEGPVWLFTTRDSAASPDVVVLDYCDVSGGWNSHNGLGLDREVKKEGFASLKSEGAGTDWFSKKFETPLDTRCDEDSHLDLWLYVSDVSRFDGGGQLEITSSGRPDVDEYSWQVGSLGLSNGWNQLHLQIGSAGRNGNPDLGAINYFRFYQFVSGEVLSRVDFIRFSGITGETPTGNASPPAEEVAGTRIYPNPVSGLLHIEMEKGVSARVIDLTGRNLWRFPLENPITVVPVDGLIPGIYFLELKSGNETVIHQLIRK